ncbi:MAG TPA: DUF3488 domain-containing protein, partial [Thermoguttaceae bacterium]|nr:DUF3488 domain-containing protein [Thermoguttaceae bacterium]
MKVERSLQVNMAMLTVTSALLYGMGQRDLRLALLVMVASAAAIWLTDVKQWFRLNRFTASILAMGVFLMVVGRMFSWNNLMSIRAIANLLVYLQIILLFQRKDGRVYWQLIVLSLLLLVVSTVFNQGALFGLLMVAYLYMAISAMALLFLYHEEKRYVPVEPIADESADATDPRRAWPLGTRESFFLGDAARRQDPAGRPGRDFLRRLVGMGVGTLLFTAVVFFAMPRFGQTAWRSPFHQQRRMVGYSGKVELGDLGRVSEDPAEVLRIEFTDPGTGRMVPMDGAVYLHGTVLTRYEGRCWTLPHPRDTPRRLRVVAPPRGETVVQTVTIEPMDRAEVFCVQPFFTVEKQFNLWFD